MKSKACHRMLRRNLRKAFWANCFLAIFCILTPAGLAAQDTLSELRLPGADVAGQASVTTGPLSILNWAGFAGAVSFTFDDSQPSQIQHFTELQATGVRMTLYISTGDSTQTNYDATWSAAAKSGNEIGNHTVHHCHANLTGCAFGTGTGSLASEIDQATSFITQRYPQSAVWTGASPYGDGGYDSTAASRFFLYRGVGGGSIGPNDGTDPFHLPCHMAASGETAAGFNAATDAAQAAGRWQIFLIHTITPTPNIWFNPVNIADVTGAMNHAKLLGNVWVDTVANIGAYWRGQKILASTTPVVAARTTTWNWQLPAHFPAGKTLRVMIASGILSQNGVPLVKSTQGFYTVSLDARSLTLTQ